MATGFHFMSTGNGQGVKDSGCLNVETVPAASVGLVSTTKTASPSKGERRVRRYALQNEARHLLPEHRVGACLRILKRDAKEVRVLYDAEHEAAHYGGLVVCGSVWVCPVCAAVITERRADELRAAIERHPELTPVMVTVTLQHGRRDALDDLLKALKGGMRFARSGKRWMALKDRFGIEGSVTATEVTWGRANGWHPHEHILFFCNRSDVDPAELAAYLGERFGVFLGREGRYVSPEFGVHVMKGGAAVGAYLSKWDAACELVKGNVKLARSDGGFSPWMLLAASLNGDAWAGDLFREYAWAMFGKRLLVYTKGLRGLLGLADDKLDEQIAEQDEEAAVVLAALTPFQWRHVLAFDARAEVLNVASTGDAARLWAYLARLWRGGDDDPAAMLSGIGVVVEVKAL